MNCINCETCPALKTAREKGHFLILLARVLARLEGKSTGEKPEQLLEQYRQELDDLATFDVPTVRD